jgi:hypothetical protein
VDVTRGLEDLLVVALVAALAPVVVALLPGPRIPQVVIFLIGGVLIGPHGLRPRRLGQHQAAVQHRHTTGLEHKFDAAGYGIFSGLPSLLVYRRVLSMRQRVQMTFITATTRESQASETGRAGEAGGELAASG